MFKKENKLWDHPNAKKNWFKKGQHPSLKTEFKKGDIPWIKGKLKNDRTIEIFCACGCGQLKYKYDIQGRERKYIYGHHMKGHMVSEETIRNLILANKRKKGKPLTKEHIQKIKKARIKQILPIKDTSIEVKIQNFLTELQIEYLAHKHMNINHSYQCDILIPSMNLVIECDGIYWHKYPMRREIDNIRTSELIEKGFKVLRLWEFEINEMSINDFKNKLEDIKNYGK